MWPDRGRTYPGVTDRHSNHLNFRGLAIIIHLKRFVSSFLLLTGERYISTFVASCLVRHRIFRGTHYVHRTGHYQTT